LRTSADDASPNGGLQHLKKGCQKNNKEIRREITTPSVPVIRPVLENNETSGHSVWNKLTTGVKYNISTYPATKNQTQPYFNFTSIRLRILPFEIVN
jgi:hypothetical protein